MLIAYLCLCFGYAFGQSSEKEAAVLEIGPAVSQSLTEVRNEKGASLSTTHLSSDREAAWPERGIQVKNAGFTLLRCTERWIIVPYQ